MYYLLALLAGVLNALSFSPFDWWPLLVPSFATLFWMWLQSSSSKSFWLGLVFGIGQFGVGASWVYVSIQSFGGMPPVLAGLCVAVFVIILSLFAGATGWCQGLFQRHSHLSRLVFIVPLTYLLFEWVRGWIFSGFPWLTTGYAFLETPLAGLAPIGGVYIVSLIVLISIGTLASLLIVVDRKTVGIAFLLTLIWGGSWFANSYSWTKSQGHIINVAILQNNIDLLDKWNPVRRNEILEEYLQISDAHRDKDLIVWPEGAVPDYLNNLPKEFWQRLENHPSDFAFGGLYQPENTDRYHNTIAAVGDKVLLYSKQHLVPFGEYFPMQKLLGPILKYLTIPMSNFSPWESKQAPLPLAGINFAASICYEDAFPGEWRNQVPTAGALINVSEDMWFGDSFAPHQRLQMAQFRARETERPMVRSSNNGLSSLIDWQGQVQVIAPQFEKAVVVGKIQPRSGVTPYVQYGNYPALILAIILLIPAILFGRRAVR